MGPIFNEKSCWKVEFVGPWIVHRCTIHYGKPMLHGHGHGHGHGDTAIFEN